MIDGCCSAASRLIPLPIRDVYRFKKQIKRATIKINAPTSGTGTISESTSRQLRNVMNLYTSIGRITLAAIGAFSFYSAAASFGFSFGLCSLAIITGSILSIPATAIVVGSSLLYYGVASLIHSITAGIFLTIATDILICCTGLFILESYRIRLLSFGFAEKVIHDCAVKLQEKYYINNEDDDVEMGKK